MMQDTSVTRGWWGQVNHESEDNGEDSLWWFPPEHEPEMWDSLCLGRLHGIPRKPQALSRLVYKASHFPQPG